MTRQRQEVSRTRARPSDTELSGDVTVATNGREMHCDRLTYEASTQDLKMSGTVRFEDAAMRVTGDAGNYGTDGALFTHAQFEMLQHPGRGVADSVSMRQPNIVELNNVSYTTCPRETPDWELDARRITLDTKSMRGVGHHTVVVFKGVPILYLPWISFPLSDARQSGFVHVERCQQNFACLACLIDSNRGRVGVACRNGDHAIN